MSRFSLGIKSTITAVALAAAMTTFAATPSFATGGLYFKYAGITCGPDQNAIIGIVSSGSGHITGEYAYAADGSEAFNGYSFTAGSHQVVVPSRSLNSYDYKSDGGAKLVARSVSCR